MPLPNSELPLLTVRPDIVVMRLAVVMSNIRKRLPGLFPLTVRRFAPGPAIVTGSVMAGSGFLRLIVQTPAEHNGSVAGMLNLMMASLPAFARVIAARRVHWAELKTQALATIVSVSDVVFTEYPDADSNRAMRLRVIAGAPLGVSWVKTPPMRILPSD